MAFIGNCEFHGQYCNSCDGCEKERPARLVVEKIKAGMDPDEALRQVLENDRKDKSDREHRESQERFEESARTMARIRWQDQNTPEHLKPKGPIFG